MKKILCTFLIAMLALTVSAQNDNIQRPPKKTDQQVPPKRTQPAKPATTTQQNAPSKPSTPSKLVSSKPTTGYENGHEWVDLGLSVKWATMNVGASSPSDYGGYYAWGETSTKSRYDWDSCFDYLDNRSWGTYKLGGQTRITPSSGHDTARENWGGTWRMPTGADNEELCKKCRWIWTFQGYKVTGPNGNSIFLPAAGWRDGTNTNGEGEDGYYWSSTLSSLGSDDARYLYFFSSVHLTSIYQRRNGLCVRPVTD